MINLYWARPEFAYLSGLLVAIVKDFLQVSLCDLHEFVNKAVYAALEGFDPSLGEAT